MLFKKRALTTTKDADMSQWTLDTLREYFLAILTANDARYSERFESSQTALNAALTAQQTSVQAALTAQKLAVDTAQTAANQAVNKAEMAAEKRFESVNEFRNTLADQQRTLMPRAEAELLFKTLTEKIDANTQALLATSAQKAGLKDGWAYFIGGAGALAAIVAVIGYILKP